MTALDTRLAEIDARLKAATPWPWTVEECGEKGDGSHMVGVTFAMEGDPNCARPLSGWLTPYDDLGNKIEYYRDQLIADCDFHNGNSGADAIFIAHAPSDIAFLREELRKAHAERDELKEDFAAHEKYVDECVQEKLDEMGADAASFDKELWKVVRHFLEKQPGFEWSMCPDGIDPDGVGEWLSETMHAMDEQAKRLTAARDNAAKEMQERAAKVADEISKACRINLPNCQSDQETERQSAYLEIAEEIAEDIRALTKDGAT